MLTFINPCHSRHGQSNTPIDSIVLLLNGDSIIADVADIPTSQTELIGDLSSYGVTTSIQDMAQGGTTLTYEAGQGSTNWWDERTDVKGVIYNFIADPISNKSDYTDIIISLGTNDHGLVLGQLTKAELVNDYSNYIDQLKSDFTNLERIYIAPMARHSYSDKNQEWHLMREVQYELVAQRADCYMLPEFYDLAFADTVHLNAASVTKRSDRYAARVSYILGMNNKPTLGMEITSAIMDDDGCLCTIKHHDGDDWTLPDTNKAKALLRAESDGTFVNLQNHAIEKISATQLRINGAPWSEPTLQTVWGTLGLIAGEAPNYGANTEPTLPYDNSALELPFMHSAIAPTDTDVIRSITNLSYHVRASYKKTYDSGVDIATIQSINGKTLSNLSAGQFPDYAATAFGGNDGIEFTSSNSLLSADDGFPSQETLFAFGSVYTPASVASSFTLFSLGTSNTVGTQARLYIDTDGQLKYGVNDGFGVVTIGGDYRDSTFIWAINYRSNAAADIYINDFTTPVATVNPRNSYPFQNDLFIGGCTGAQYREFGIKLGIHDSVNDPSLSAIEVALKVGANI
jgi:hypothetical protein